MLEAFSVIKTRCVIPTDTRVFFGTTVFQIIVNTVKRNFEQRSELLITNCLTVQVLSSGYNIPSFKL